MPRAEETHAHAYCSVLLKKELRKTVVSADSVQGIEPQRHARGTQEMFGGMQRCPLKLEMRNTQVLLEQGRSI